MGSRGDSRSTWSRPWAALLVALVVALATAGCTSDEPPAEEESAPVVQLGAPGEAGETLSPDEAEAIEEPTFTDADVEFVQMMIPHHQQALEMTALVEDRAADRDLAQLAERIEVSQQDEIALLEGWLNERGEMVSGMHDGHGGHADHTQMPGMLTRAQLDQLARSSGERFDRLFLRGMIRHHRGAVAMSQQAARDGADVIVGEMTADVNATQTAEIDRMRDLLAQL